MVRQRVEVGLIQRFGLGCEAVVGLVEDLPSRPNQGQLSPPGEVERGGGGPRPRTYSERWKDERRRRWEESFGLARAS